MGYKTSEVIGKSPEFFINDFDWNNVKERIKRLFEGIKISAKEFDMTSKSGENIPFEGNSKLIKKLS